MKKIKKLLTSALSIVLALVMLFQLVACSNSKPEPETNGDPDAPTAPPPDDDFIEFPVDEIIAVVVNLAQKQPLVGEKTETNRVISADKLGSYDTALVATSQDGLGSYSSDKIAVVYDTNADEYGVVDTVTVNDTILLEQGYYTLFEEDLSLSSLYAEYYEVEIDYTQDGKVEGLYYYDRYYIYHYTADGNLKDIYMNGSLYKEFTYNANNNIVKEVSITKDNSFEKNYAYSEDGKLHSVNGVSVNTHPQVDKSSFVYNYTFHDEKFITSKTVNGVKTTYKYVGDKVVEITKGNQVVSYILDKDLNYVGLSYGDVKYYFAVDPFGNVMGLVDADGNFAVEYQYDIWGNVVGISGDLAETLGVLNEIVNLNGLYDHDINCYFFAEDIYVPASGITLRQSGTFHARSMYEWEQSNYFSRSAVSSFARIHDMVVDVAVKNLREQGVDVVSNLYATDANGDSKRLVDIYTLDYSLTPFATKNLLHGNQIYEVIYHAPDSEKFEQIATAKLQKITGIWNVSYFSDYSPEAGKMTFNGQFIFLGYLIDYKCVENGIIEYQVKNNVKQNYDQTVNIYDYDNNKYVCYVNNTFDLNFLDGVPIIPGINREQYEALDGYLQDYLQSVSGNICDQMLIYDDPNYYDLKNMNVTPDYWAQMNLESTTTYLEIQSDGTIAAKTMPVVETDGFATKILIGAGVVLVTAVVATIAIMIPGANCVVVSICVGAAKGAAIGAASGFAMGFVEEGINATIEGIRTGNWNFDFEAALSAAVDGFASGAITGAIMGGISGGLNPKYCFEAGTPIAAANGAVAIENIAVGDMVWSYDYKTGKKSLKPVTATTIRETNQVISVEIGGEQIVTTPEHPFYVVNNDKYNGYVAAKYLSIGDCVQTAEGGYLPITSIKQETLDDSIAVYNFTVDDNHSYYVGENELLVHNIECTSGRKVAGNNNYQSDHCRRHATSVGADPKNPLDYWQKADDFISDSLKNTTKVPKGTDFNSFSNIVNNAKSSGKSVSFLGKDGKNYFYNPAQGKFAITSGDNSTILTFYDIAHKPLQYIWGKL